VAPVAAPRPTLHFRSFPEFNENGGVKMARQVPFDEQTHAEIARKQYLEYEYNQNNPDAAEDEAARHVWLRRLKKALDVLTPRQRKVYILLVGYGLSETAIAEMLNISQQAVAERYKRAEKKLRQFR
jgi:RNA polymerase sigma factor (sigma-70 family)